MRALQSPTVGVRDSYYARRRTLYRALSSSPTLAAIVLEGGAISLGQIVVTAQVSLSAELLPGE